MKSRRSDRMTPDFEPDLTYEFAAIDSSSDLREQEKNRRVNESELN